MKKVCALIGKYFGVIAVIFLIIGMTLPTSFLGSSARWAAFPFSPSSSASSCSAWA